MKQPKPEGHATSAAANGHREDRPVTAHAPQRPPQSESWLFAPGRIVATPAAVTVLGHAGIGAEALLMRHLSGDWGSVCKEDREENEMSLREGFRLFSVYPLSDSEDIIWIITEADRSATTLLCPHEY